jgi:hypothetical protein
VKIDQNHQADTPKGGKVSEVLIKTGITHVVTTKILLAIPFRRQREEGKGVARRPSCIATVTIVHWRRGKHE